MIDRSPRKKAQFGDATPVPALASRGDSAQGGDKSIIAALNAKPFIPAPRVSVSPGTGTACLLSWTAWMGRVLRLAGPVA